MFLRLIPCAWRKTERRALLLAVLALAAGPKGRAAYSEAQFRAVTTANEEQVNQIRDQEINQIRVVLGRRFSESRRPDILLRLAELYIEKYRFYFFKENEIHQGLLKRGERPKFVDHTRSRGLLKSAESASVSILRSKVPFDKMDQVYYFLAYNAQELGKQKEAVRYFEAIAAKYPRSQYAAESYRNIGEYEFSKNNFARALKYYEKAARYSSLPSYPRTLYKLAWAYFKTRQKERALAVMKEVAAKSQDNDKFISLRDEALNDLVRFFAEAGRGKEAYSYFSQIKGGPELYTKALNKLASTYASQGRNDMALRVNEELIRIYSEDRPELVMEALSKNVELHKKAGDVKKEALALERLVDHLAKHGEIAAKSDDALAATLRVKGYLRARAGEIHKQAQGKKERDSYLRAADLYGLYLKVFAEGASSGQERSDVNQVRVYRADCLLAAGSESAALDELERALNDSSDSKLKREAGATALNLLLKRLDQAKENARTSAELESRFARVADVFEGKFPGDPLAAEIRYKRARLAARKSGAEGLSSEARDALFELIERYPSRPESLLAAQDLVDDLRKQKKEDAAAELASKMLLNAKLMAGDAKRELKRYLDSIIAREGFSKVKAVEKGQDYESAARQYEALAARNRSDSEVAFKSLNNAAVNFEKARLAADASRVYRRLLKEFPKSSAGKEGLKRLADVALYEGRFLDAAKAYRDLSAMNPYSLQERASFAVLAATIFWDFKDHGNAYLLLQALFRERCARPPKPADYENCRNWEYAQGEVLRDAGRFQDALAQFKKMADSRAPYGARRAEAARQGALLYEKFAETAKARALLEKASGLAGKGRLKEAWQIRERNHAAGAAFRLLEPAFASFDSIRLELPESALKNSTKKKLSELERLVARCNQVVSIGDGEWGTAALVRLGSAFRDFAAELSAAPAPPSLSAEQKAQYQREIRSISVPMAARAQDYFEQAYKLGVKLRIATENFSFTRALLGTHLLKQRPAALYFRDDYVKEPFWGLRLLSSGSGGAGSGGGETKRYVDLLKADPKNASAWIDFGADAATSGYFRIASAFFEQAISLGSRSRSGGSSLGIAWSDLALLSMLRGEYFEAQNQFEKALAIAELQTDILGNLARFDVYFSQHARGLELLQKLKARLPEAFEKEFAAPYAVALLGAGDLSGAKERLEKISAKDSDSPTLWYNWSVVSLAAGSEDDRSEALKLLKSRRASLPREAQAIADSLLRSGR